MKQKFENIIVPPDQVQVKVADWQSRNEPVLLAAGQESLFLELVGDLLGERPLTFASLLIDNQSQCGLVVDNCPQIQQML